MKSAGHGRYPIVKKGLILVLFVFVAGVFPGKDDQSFGIEKAPSKKPASLMGIAPKPWTDYVIDSLVVDRDAAGNVKVRVVYKNLGDIDRGVPCVAFGLERPGAAWTEVCGNITGWYALPDMSALGGAATIKAKVDSKSEIAEVNELNNECIVNLAPRATHGVSNCY